MAFTNEEVKSFFNQATNIYNIWRNKFNLSKIPFINTFGFEKMVIFKRID